MGCDIIMHCQVKNFASKWVVYDRNIYDHRNYTLFGILAGVRGSEFKPISEMKGYPEDSEDPLKEPGPWDYDCVTVGGDYYGYAGVSWLTLTELKSFDWNQPNPHWPEQKLSEWEFCTKVMAYLEAVAEKFGGPDNVRIVFGFSV